MRLIALILFLAFVAAAQVTDGVATTVSRTVNVVPDEADFSVTIDTSLDVTQDEVVQVLRDAGIQNLTVISVGSASPIQIYDPSSGTAIVRARLEYQIAFTTAPAALTTFMRKLDAIEAKLPSGFASMQYTASLSASQAAINSASQAALPQLLQDARTKAQALAAAASLRLGAITAISDVGSAPEAVGGVLIGVFTSVVSGSPNTFTLAVRFAAQ